MLRLLALLAGLLLVVLAIVSLRWHAAEPLSTPAVETAWRPEERGAAPLSAAEEKTRDAAAAPQSPTASYVSLAGELTREEDGTPIEGGLIVFGYRYLSKGPESEVRLVPVDVDAQGKFEQVFSEPVQLVRCEIKPPELEMPGNRAWAGGAEMADFLKTGRELDVRVVSMETQLAFRVPSGLEIRGRVFDRT